MFTSYVTYVKTEKKHAFAIYQNQGVWVLDVQYIGQLNGVITRLGANTKEMPEIIAAKRNELLAKGYKEFKVENQTGYSSDSWSYAR